jgi:hypothetical protein
MLEASHSSLTSDPNMWMVGHRTMSFEDGSVLGLVENFAGKIGLSSDFLFLVSAVSI